MATWFEMWLIGEDREQVTAVGDAAMDEIERVERLLSRFDPAAEVARINRFAAQGPVRVDPEMASVLEDCRQWFAFTRGCFDPCASSQQSWESAVHWDFASRTLRLLTPQAKLDFGAYGKGYALDAAAQILTRFGVQHALLHGGTSSVLARGMRADGSPWPIGVRDPFLREACEIGQLQLSGCGLSTSAALGPQSAASDIVDPQSGQPLRQQAACVAIAPTATQAEVLSTALLAMGERAARAFCREHYGAESPDVAVAWIGRNGDRSKLQWLVAPRQTENHNSVIRYRPCGSFASGERINFKSTP